MTSERLFCVTVILIAGICLCTPGLVWADDESISIKVEPDDIGLYGVVRPGAWTPMQVTIDNQSAQPREVRCQWVVSDADGDRVYAQRLVTLSPRRVGRVWLYAMLPASTPSKATWRVNVVDEQRGDTLATQNVWPAKVLSGYERVIGVVGSRLLGLDRYESRVTRYEGCHFVRGIDPTRLPDRWHGLSGMQALIWTADGGDPGSLGVSGDTVRAIQNWVRRGGHLVVSLGTVGDAWFDSPLQGLLPQVKVNRVYGMQPPTWLGKPAAGKRVSPIDVKAFEPLPADTERASVLLHDNKGRALVVASRWGFGRVTLIGVDLADPVLAAMGLPEGGGKGLWSKVFGWQGPVYSKSYLDREIEQRRMLSPDYRQHVELDRFIPGVIAMRGTATAALLAAMIFFGMYWLLAGPIGFAVLKRRRRVQHSWIAFVAVVMIASVVAWGGSWVLRPSKLSMAHFTVLDIDAPSGLMHSRSWISLFVPKHGQVDVAVGRDENALGSNLLASPGTQGPSGEAGFIDPQAYEINAATPANVTVPIRATAKQFEIDCLGWLASADGDGASQAPITSSNGLQIKDGWPTGELVHSLPGAVSNVLMVYCPGDGKTPVIWRRRDPWPAGEPMIVQHPDNPEQLVAPYLYDQDNARLWKNEGYLGRLIAFKTGQAWGAEESVGAIVADSEMVQAVEMLTFFDMLPPPDFLNTNFVNRSVNYARGLGRGLDLTPQTVMRCLIVIGHLHDTPVPLPVTVDGSGVESSGRTVVRWVCPL